MSILSQSPFHLKADDVQWVEQTLGRLSVEEKVGQLFVLMQGMGSNLDAELMQRVKPGGVHVFGSDPEDVKRRQQEIIRDLQRNSSLPLLISGDLESGGQGGAVDGTNLGTNMQVAAANDTHLSYAFGKAIETEGTAMGFNWVFGPVVDINYNHQNPIVNIRAFGDTPEVVIRHSVPIVSGIQKSGKMAACIKHWPGDGLDDRDQHKVLTINTMPMDRWRETFGSVYRQAFAAGVKTVMSAHIALPAYYEELGIADVRTKYTPGSLSYELNMKLLREELGFNGLIVSDATTMIGMQSWGPRSEIVPRCIAAGVDMFLFTGDTGYDYESMLQGVRNGTISEQRLNEAVTRILGLKASLGLHKAVWNEPPAQLVEKLNAVGSPAHWELAWQLAKQSATLVKDTQHILPLSPGKQKIILLHVVSDDNSFFGDKGFIGDEIEEMLVKEGFEVVRQYELKEEANEVDAVIILAKKTPGFLQPTMRLTLHDMGGLFTWYPTRIPTIFISLGNPYTLYEMPFVPTLINGYNSTTEVQKEIVNGLLGKQPFLGVSPVDAFCGLEVARL